MTMTKQVALSDHAYARLRRQRLPGESFSAAIERLIEHQAKDPLSFGKRVRGLRKTMTSKELLAMIEADREGTRPSLRGNPWQGSRTRTASGPCRPWRNRFPLRIQAANGCSRPPSTARGCIA